MTALSAWPTQAQDWLDERGKPAWIAAMILGFVVFWPAGLAILAYMIWSKRMFNGSCRHGRHQARMMHRHGMRSSGNTAFDSYKTDTLRRLEEEQEAFETFLQRLRDAKDKTEFDAFMDDRARAARSEGTGPSDPAN
ncbi:MAG: DUF2852 domain-containing protein [Rhodobacteraceae bacterium]|nr:DUF2852 domain-containing protein [Paracoccaceae bacterium]